jgi:hypothetical protein
MQKARNANTPRPTPELQKMTGFCGELFLPGKSAGGGKLRSRAR